MRKITSESINAFMNGQDYRKSNTDVESRMNGRISYMTLHGNLIAIRVSDTIFISNAGWFSKTTKDRLNGLPGVSISQRNFVWYLNDQKWSGDWINVNTMEPTNVSFLFNTWEEMINKGVSDLYSN